MEVTAQQSKIGSVVLPARDVSTTGFRSDLAWQPQASIVRVRDVGTPVSFRIPLCDSPDGSAASRSTEAGTSTVSSIQEAFHYNGRLTTSTGNSLHETERLQPVAQDRAKGLIKRNLSFRKKTKDNTDKFQHHSGVPHRFLAHYDYVSILFSLEDVKTAAKVYTDTNLQKNTLSGASAAAAAMSSTGADDSGQTGTSSEMGSRKGSVSDDGEHRSNDMVLACPSFTIEVGDRNCSNHPLCLLPVKTHRSNHLFSGGRGPTTTSSSSSINSQYHTVFERLSNQSVIIKWDQGETGNSTRVYNLEFMDYGAFYYREHFLGQDHINLVGIDETYGPVACSIRKEELSVASNSAYEELEKTATKTIYRVIFRTLLCKSITGLRKLVSEDIDKARPEDEVLDACPGPLRVVMLEDSVPGLQKQHHSKGYPVYRSLLEFLIPDLQVSCLSIAERSPKVPEMLLKIDETTMTMEYKVGMLLCAKGQNTEEQMYNNEFSSPEFDEFLELIGQKVELKGFKGFRAQLDVATDSTGTHSVYTKFENREIMFHVSTLLPFSKSNRQQIYRKRHIGNDIVTVVFQEPGSFPFTPRSFRSNYQHVFIIVKVELTPEPMYRVAVSRSNDVPQFGPSIFSDMKFRKDQHFREFLLTKIINAENASKRCNKFSAMETRTRYQQLEQLAKTCATTSTLESTRGFGISLFVWSSTKKDKNRQITLPDLYLNEAITWAVEVILPNSNDSLQCILVVSMLRIILIERATKEILIAIPSSEVLGWKLVSLHSLKIFHGRGSALHVSLSVPDIEELYKLKLRLKVASNGIEAQSLRYCISSSSSSHGFTLRSNGLVWDVEPGEAAWNCGLMKGNRIIEVNGVLILGMRKEAVLNLMRTAGGVMLTVLQAPFDNRNRGMSHYGSLRRCSSASTLYSVGRTRRSSRDSSFSTEAVQGTEPPPSGEEKLHPEASPQDAEQPGPSSEPAGSGSKFIQVEPPATAAAAIEDGKVHLDPELIELELKVNSMRKSITAKTMHAQKKHSVGSVPISRIMLDGPEWTVSTEPSSHSESRRPFLISGVSGAKLSSDSKCSPSENDLRCVVPRTRIIGALARHMSELSDSDPVSSSSTDSSHAILASNAASREAVKGDLSPTDPRGATSVDSLGSQDSLSRAQRRSATKQVVGIAPIGWNTHSSNAKSKPDGCSGSKTGPQKETPAQLVPTAGSRTSSMYDPSVPSNIPKVFLPIVSSPTGTWGSRQTSSSKKASQDHRTSLDGSSLVQGVVPGPFLMTPSSQVRTPRADPLPLVTTTDVRPGLPSAFCEVTSPRPKPNLYISRRHERSTEPLTVIRNPGTGLAPGLPADNLAVASPREPSPEVPISDAEQSLVNALSELHLSLQNLPQSSGEASQGSSLKADQMNSPQAPPLGIQTLGRVLKHPTLHGNYSTTERRVSQPTLSPSFHPLRSPATSSPRRQDTLKSSVQSKILAFESIGRSSAMPRSDTGTSPLRQNVVASSSNVVPLGAAGSASGKDRMERKMLRMVGKSHTVTDTPSITPSSSEDCRLSSESEPCPSPRVRARSFDSPYKEVICSCCMGMLGLKSSIQPDSEVKCTCRCRQRVSSVQGSGPSFVEYLPDPSGYAEADCSPLRAAEPRKRRADSAPEDFRALSVAVCPVGGAESHDMTASVPGQLNCKD